MACHCKTAKPKVFIPAFPGTNCEEDSARAFERAGAKTEILFSTTYRPTISKEVSSKWRQKSKKQISSCFPAGFSAGDEPDGSEIYRFCVKKRND